MRRIEILAKDIFDKIDKYSYLISDETSEEGLAALIKNEEKFYKERCYYKNVSIKVFSE